MPVDTEGLFAAHHQRLFKYFCRVVGQADTARDLTQDVFVRVTGAAIPQGGDSEARAWLFHIARNLALDYHRRRSVRPVAAVSAPEASRGPTQDVELAVNTAVATLPDLDRDAFLMREVGGLSYQEIAQACGLTPDAVRSRIHRARLQLRAQLAEPIATRRTIPMRRTGHDR